MFHSTDFYDETINMTAKGIIYRIVHILKLNNRTLMCEPQKADGQFDKKNLKLAVFDREINCADFDSFTMKIR